MKGVNDMPVMTLAISDLTSLIDGIKSGATWIFSLFEKVVDVITSNSLLLYPVIFFLVMGAVGLVIGIVRKFGMRSRTR